jgi:5-methylcytosine-specific restriction endonuclease McrA
MPAGYVSRLWAKQSGLCNACRGSLTILGYHVDHIVAVSNGGKHVEGNVQLLCPSDNRRKAAKDFAAFLREF